jgi:Ca2+-binding EF-hand superfamily protein
LHSQETLADKTKSVEAMPDKETEVKQDSVEDEYKLVGLVAPSDDEDEKINFVDIVEKHLGLSTEALSDHVYALRRTISLDRSCFTADTDIVDIVDPNPNLTVDDVKKAFTCLRDEGGKVDKETFVKTMMDFFPRYNMEANRTKLEKLFDRLDHKDEGLISFRQFMLVTIAFSTVSLEDKLTRIFKLIDENENEELSFEEFQEVVHDILVLKEERKMSASHIGSRFSADTFRYMGMNADGNIILRDFVDACKQQKFILINYIENFRDGFQTS